MQKIDEIANGQEVIHLLHRKYDFNINLYILQCMLECHKEEELANLCVEFARDNKLMYYYQGHVETEGM
jgi:hypothetical protein